MKLVDRVKSRIAALRARSPFVDHVVRMQEHFSEAKGGQQAGGVTYFGFLSVFPVLALAFFAVGYVANVFPEAQDALLEAIDEVLPGLVGNRPNEVPLDDIQSAAGAVGLIGLAGVLYAGLGWLSSLQTALIALFEMPERLQPSFIVGKLRDLLTLVVLGVVLLLSVAVSGVLTRMSEQILEWTHLDSSLGYLVAVLALAVGLVASALLFFLMFRLLARPPVPAAALWAGAWLGAIGFEALKQLSGLLLVGTRGQPAFQAFGIALILLVWINYFSRVTLYAAAWAYTSPAARAERDARRDAALPVAVATVSLPEQEGQEGQEPQEAKDAEDAGGAWVAPLAIGGAIGAILGARMGSRRRG